MISRYHLLCKNDPNEDIVMNDGKTYIYSSYVNS